MRASTSPRVVWRIATAIVSGLAIVLAVAYLVAPARTALAVNVDVDSSIKVPAGKILIYGKAGDYRGKPVANVRISVTRAGRERLALVSGADGTFRKTSSLKSAEYVLGVSRRYKGETRRTKRSITLTRGNAYRVAARIVRSGGLTILPVRAY
jgi:hypothetical protein